MNNKVVYVDNNATTMVAPEVTSAMLPFLKNFYGNPSSMHFFGGQVKKHLEHAREQVSALINCDTTELVITSCGSESDNMGIRCALEALDNDRNHLITSKVEHPAVKNTMEYLAKKGYKVTEVAVDSRGMLDMKHLKSCISDKTALVSIMHANNETGVIFPIEEIGEIVKENGALFHIDAVQSVGKIPIDLKKSTVDLLSLSGHKIHAPKGIGALHLRKGVRIKPLIIGGHQEKGRRGGTEAIPNIIALGKAAELAKKNMSIEQDKVKQKRDRLENWILKNIPDTILNGDRLSRLPNTSNIGFKYIEGEAILLMLSQLGICASSGSACTSGSLEPSHVLRAMKVPFEAMHGSIRFSLSIYNSDEDIDYIINNLEPLIKKLREISPFVK